MNAIFLKSTSLLQQQTHLQWERLQIALGVRFAGHRSGRVLLHLVCACGDHQFKWHLNGIARELGARIAFAS